MKCPICFTIEEYGSYLSKDYISDMSAKEKAYFATNDAANAGWYESRKEYDQDLLAIKAKYSK